MTVILSILIGALYAAGLYMLMRRSIVKLVLGLALISHAANLLILVSPGITRGISPLARAGEMAPPPGAADPLPQALILTAIVISFAVTAFSIVLVHRVHAAVKNDDLDVMTTTDT